MNLKVGLESDWIDFEMLASGFEEEEFQISDDEEVDVEEMIEFYQKKYGMKRVAR